MRHRLSGTFVCNIGDMLDRMTRGCIAQPAPRTAESTLRRLSFPLFFDPNFSPAGTDRRTGTRDARRRSRDAVDQGERARVRRDVRRLLAREDLQGVSAAEPAGAVGHSCPAFTSPGSAGRCIRIRSAIDVGVGHRQAYCRGQSPGATTRSGRKNGLARLDDHFQHLTSLKSDNAQGPGGRCRWD